jgi:protein TonB
MRERIPAPEVTAMDRFGFTLFASIVFNAVLILGVSFTMDKLDPEDTMSPTLEITLVPTESKKAPEEADFLAQSNQQAGGDLDEKAKPQTPSPAMFTTSDTSATPVFMPKLEAQPKPKQITKEVLTATDADVKIYTSSKEQLETPETTPATATELVVRSQEIAKLSAELSEKLQAYSKRPRHKYKSANTKEYKYATYISEWQKKIERVGRLNFPDEAKRRRLAGDLLLDVAVRADGTIYEITLRRSSGYKILDDAAIRIVRLAAPFAPFSESIRKEADILHISRTWKFLPGGEVSAK